MANYRDKHSGILYSQNQIDRNLRKAKSAFIDKFILEHGYLFCVRCKRSNVIFNVSHNTSINDCKKQGLIEYIWDEENFELLCQEICHKAKDRLYIGKIDTSFMP